MDQAKSKSRFRGLRTFEPVVVEQLFYMLGSKGGVYRRWGKDDDSKYKDSADAYDAGYDIEKCGRADYKIFNSYNLVQRLVARVLVRPAAVLDEDIPVWGLWVRRRLLAAAKEIKRQQEEEGRGNDVYAAADLALVQLLLGEHGREWEKTLDQFLNWKPSEPYARQVTFEVIEEIYQKVSDSPSAPASLVDHLSDAIEEFSYA